MLARVGSGRQTRVVAHRYGRHVPTRTKRILFGLAIAFALTVVALGRLRGLTALAGLAVSIGVLLWFVLPAVLDGRNPLAVAVVGSAAIAFLALYLAHRL